VISFGPFQLFAFERRLLKDAAPVSIGSRALDILITLVEHAGQTVSKRDIVSRVWPGVVVEESSLRVHVGGLRKALGDGVEGARYIENVPGRGYCFVAPIIRAVPSNAGATVGAASVEPACRLPAKLARMIGRDHTVATLRSQLLTERFVSVVGPGGMGKTTVAVAVAHSVLTEFSGNVAFVDLGAIEAPLMVAAAAASAVGLTVGAGDLLPSLTSFFEHRHSLLVLDGCEHVIDAVAALTETLYLSVPRLHILVTSREALRVEGEHVNRLDPLGVPDTEGDLTAAEVLGFPAAQLFMERVAASGNRINLSDTEARVVARICRRLDGIALALELAAGRVGAHGLLGTAELLEMRFKLLWQGRRTAPHRHQTLNALLDWSHNLLTEMEQRVLRRLSAFVGTFTLAAAQAVATGADLSAEEVFQAVANLVAKSLVSTQTLAGAAYYRLLDVTRAYASVKLTEAGEEEIVSRHHAEYFVDCCSREHQVVSNTSVPLALGTDYLGNIRAGLEWCFSIGGDLYTGCDLVRAVAPLLLRLGLLGECHRWSERALTNLPETEKGTQRELSLLVSQATSAMFTLGNDPRTQDTIKRGLDLASVLGATALQFELLAGLNIFLTRIGDFQAALSVGHEALAVARTLPDSTATEVANWMLGVANHLMGDQCAAQLHCEGGLERKVGAPLGNRQAFGYDHRIRTLVFLARTLWLRGFADRAVSVAHQALDEAARVDNPVNVCISLIYTSSVFLWRGDWQAAETGITQLLAAAKKHSLNPYHAGGVGLHGELLIRQGLHSSGIVELRRALDILAAERHLIQAPEFGGVLAEGLAATGQVDEALATIDRAIAQRQGSGASFDMPQMLRIKAEILMSGARPAWPLAEELLQSSLCLAREQSSLSWELRSAIALTRMRPGDRAAHSILYEIYSRFVEGFETHDLTLARCLLEGDGQA
jgi:predicted ATPase/DNA-binding winged helix-turn-helix (wHTH) protein